MSYCVKCGSPINDGSSFCSACGTPVGGQANPAPSASEPFHAASQVNTQTNATNFYHPAAQANPFMEVTEKKPLFVAKGTPAKRKALLAICGGICALGAVGAFLMWNSSRNYTGWTAITPSTPSVDFAMSAPTGLHFTDEGEWMLLITAAIALVIALLSLLVIIKSSGDYFKIYSDHVEARSGGLVTSRFTSRIAEISNVTVNPEGVNPHLSIRCKDGRSRCVLLNKEQLVQAEQILNQLIRSVR